MTAKKAAMSHARALCVTALIFFAFPFESAFAYLDPGTGSMLLQVILGGVAAATVALKLYWQRIKQVLGLAKPVDAGEEADPGNSPE